MMMNSGKKMRRAYAEIVKAVDASWGLGVYFGKISIVLEDLSRNSFFSNQSETLGF